MGGGGGGEGIHILSVCNVGIRHRTGYRVLVYSGAPRTLQSETLAGVQDGQKKVLISEWLAPVIRPPRPRRKKGSSWLLTSKKCMCGVLTTHHGRATEIVYSGGCDATPDVTERAAMSATQSIDERHVE